MPMDFGVLRDLTDISLSSSRFVIILFFASLPPRWLNSQVETHEESVFYSVDVSKPRLMHIVIEWDFVTDESPEVKEHISLGDCFGNMAKADFGPIESKIDALQSFGVWQHDRRQFMDRQGVVVGGGRVVPSSDFNVRGRVNNE